MAKRMGALEFLIRSSDAPPEHPASMRRRWECDFFAVCVRFFGTRNAVLTCLARYLLRSVMRGTFWCAIGVNLVSFAPAFYFLILFKIGREYFYAARLRGLLRQKRWCVRWVARIDVRHRFGRPTAGATGYAAAPS